MELQIVSSTEIPLGSPLPWPLYDGEGRLLLDAGFVVECESQQDILLGHGVYRDATQAATESAPIPDAEGGTEDGPGAAFERMGLQMGTPVQLTDAQSRYFGRLIGYIRDKSLLVSTPIVNGVPLLLKAGEQFTLRAFTGKNAYAFASAVMRAQSFPVHYLHMSLPLDVREAPLRRSVRAPVKLLAALLPTGDGRSWPAQVMDIATSGAMLASPYPLDDAAGALKLNLPIRLEGTDFNLQLPVVVRNRYPKDQHAYRYGVEFQQLSTSDRLVLQNLVYQTLCAQRAYGAFATG